MKKFILINILLFSLTSFAWSQTSTVPDITGYTDKSSYRVGDTIKFYLSSFVLSFIGDPYDAPVTAMGAPSTTVATVHIDTLRVQGPSNAYPWRDGYGYKLTAKWVVPSLQSGVYFIGREDHIGVPFIIKGDKSTSNITIVCPTNTINAYTTSGGKSLYAPQNDSASTVSFLRPQDFAAGNMSGLISWLTTSSYTLNIIADSDLEDTSEIAHAEPLIIIGHSEYWTRKQRLNFDNFVDNGKDAIILSGNTSWWQVQYIDSAYNVDRTKLTCYKGVIDTVANPTFAHSNDASCDPLLKTVHWNEPTLKYSILGSLGSDYGDGNRNHVQYGNYGDTCRGGFSGQKIVLPTSPILSGTDLNHGDYLNFLTGEYDATLISGRDSNGDPVLDAAALGFYHAELIAYDSNNTSGQAKYYPLIAFQKTCTSGKIINVSANHWCKDTGIGGTTFYNHCTSSYLTPDATKMEIITQNMINLLVAGSNIFVNPPVQAITMLPSAQTVGSTACIQDGSISITPCGTYITHGSRVDYKNSDIAQNQDCTTCNHATKMMSVNNTNEEEQIKPKTELGLNIYPNPNSGVFKVLVTKDGKNVKIKELKVYDIVGKVVWQTNNSSNSVFDIDISNYSKGIYYVRSINEFDEMEVKKLLNQ